MAIIMELKNRYDGLHPRAVRTIRFHAHRLSRSNAVPGMDVEDFERDLALDLIRRQPAFDSAKASFPTFADRVVAHRAATLAGRTLRLDVERRMISLDATAPGADDEQRSLLDLLQADKDGLPADELCGLRREVRAFLASLTPALQRCCTILLADNLSEAARDAGLHRSTLYESLKRLLERAEARGLAIYVRAPRQAASPAGM